MQSKFIPVLLIVAAAILLAGCEVSKSGVGSDVNLNSQPAASNQLSPTPLNLPSPAATSSAKIETMFVTIVTNAGKIKIKLLPEYAPNTVKNFLAKVKSGFYNGLTFHRVEDWVIQGGDPEGTGRGGGTMPTELSQAPFRAGSVGVARGGNIAISNDAQFFICLTDCGWLTGQYTLFGEVVEGMEVAKNIRVGTKIEQIVEAAN